MCKIERVPLRKVREGGAKGPQRGLTPVDADPKQEHIAKITALREEFPELFKDYKGK